MAVLANLHRDVTILLAEDDAGHADLIQRNLRRAGIVNPVRHFSDGQKVLEFLLGKRPDAALQSEGPFLLLLDIRMPKVSGVEVLERIKSHETLRRMPVIMVSTTDDPTEVSRCHDLGCNNYIVKPVEYGSFAETVQRLGNFLNVLEVPTLERSVAF